MSVTFWCPDAPRHRVPCRYCEAEGKRCDSYCRGYDEVSSAPEVNLSGAHAALQLSMLGVECDGEPAGRLSHGNLPGLIQRAMRVLATGETAVAATPASVSTGPQGCRVVDLGMPEERLASAQIHLMQLFGYAARHGYDVHYG